MTVVKTETLLTYSCVDILDQKDGHYFLWIYQLLFLILIVVSPIWCSIIMSWKLYALKVIIIPSNVNIKWCIMYTSALIS